jgi:hypothetical protein
VTCKKRLTALTMTFFWPKWCSMQYPTQPII